MSDILETARMLRFQSEWERRFHEYDLLLTAGVDADEAERIVSDLRKAIEAKDRKREAA